MILIDIRVPSLNSTYNVSVNEHLAVESVIHHMAERILEKEQCEMEGRSDNLVLCDLDRGIVLKKSEKLSTYGIKNGAELMLL